MSGAGSSKWAYRIRRRAKKHPTIEVEGVEFSEEIVEKATQLREVIETNENLIQQKLENSKEYIDCQQAILDIRAQIAEVQQIAKEKTNEEILKLSNQTLTKLQSFNGYSIDEKNNIYIYDTMIGRVDKSGHLNFLDILSIKGQDGTTNYTAYYFDSLLSSMKEEKLVKKYEKLTQKYQKCKKPSTKADKIMDKINKLIESDKQNIIKQYCAVLVVVKAGYEFNNTKYDKTSSIREVTANTIKRLETKLQAQNKQLKNIIAKAESEKSVTTLQTRKEFIKENINDIAKAINPNATVETVVENGKEKIVVKGMTTKEFVTAYLTAERGTTELLKQEIKDLSYGLLTNGFSFREIKENQIDNNADLQA